MPRPGKWWIGLPILAGIIYLAGDSLTRRIELDLSNRAAQLVAEEKGALDGAEVAANGRDIAISGVVLSAPGRDKALLAIGEMDGARAALDQTRPVETVHPFALKMERKGLRVTLEGDIPPGGERDRLRKELIVQGLEIIDHSRYAEGAPAVFPELAGFAARRLAEMDPGVATLSDDALSLTGDALPEIDLEKLIAAAKSPPEGARIEKMEIYPPRVSPYGWSAARKGEMIALEGFVPSGEARAHVIEKAGAIAAGAAVSDAMRIGSGAPSGDFLGAVDVALAELGKLASGKVALNEAGLSVEGAGRTNVLAAMIEEDAKANLPRGIFVDEDRGRRRGGVALCLRRDAQGRNADADGLCPRRRRARRDSRGREKGRAGRRSNRRTQSRRRRAEGFRAGGRRRPAGVGAPFQRRADLFG